jgi:sulfatase modifying factor 1
MSETQEPQPPNKTPYIPGQPLPRLWKTELDPSDDEELEETEAGLVRKKTAKSGEENGTAPKKPLKTEPKSNSTKPAKSKAKSKSAGHGDPKEKKVLLEETPTFDTVEARQRARLVVGGLSVFCVFLLFWITYSVFLSDPSDVEMTAELPSSPPPVPQVNLPPEDQARYLFNRAREVAKAGRPDEAINTLKRVVASYKGTQTAVEARMALERPSHNLPLFPDGPAVVAEQKPVVVSSVPAITPGNRPAPGPPPGMSPVATGPVAILGPDALIPVQRPGQPTKPQPAPPQSKQPQPASPQSVAPQINQPQPAQPQPAQPQPSPGPGQAVLVPPANPNPAPEMPAPVARTDAGKADIAPRGLPQRVLPHGFEARVEAGFHESGWPLVIAGKRDGGTMVLVPGGTFIMGSDRGEPAEAPAHTVRMSTFYIDQYEVTNRQFRIFLDETHHHGQPPGKWLTDEKLRDAPASAPASYVNYHDAERFALWARKRLPTEAQWEMAARSSDGRHYPWGDQPIKWSQPREFHQVDPVMSFPEDVSPYGVFDMAGNTMEWVRDWYDPKYFEKLKDKIVENPTGPSTMRFNSIQRVVKGGSKTWIVSARQGLNLDRRLGYLGFRCTLAVEGPEAAAGINPHPEKANKTGTSPAVDSAAGGTVPF